MILGLLDLILALLVCMLIYKVFWAPIRKPTCPLCTELINTKGETRYVKGKMVCRECYEFVTGGKDVQEI